MTLKIELMGLGMPHGNANQIGFDTAAGSLTATGSSQTDALVLTSNFNRFGTVGSSTGAVLPAARSQGPVVIYNGGANALTVYPNGSEKINNTTSFSVTNAKSAVFFAAGNEWIAILSA